MEALNSKRLATAENILNSYGLASLFQLWKRENRGSSNAYHNQQHQLIVALYARKLALEIGETAETVKSLFIAGLYHDYNHSGDPLIPDAENIARALESWRQARKCLNIADPSEFVAKLIKATEHNAIAENRAEEIIREADYAYILEPDRDEWLKALSRELGQEITEKSTKAYLSQLSFKHLSVADWLNSP